MLEAFLEQDTSYEQILDYQYSFSQPYPSYGIRWQEQWRTVHRTLSWQVTRDHLAHKKIIGSLGRFYPDFGILDFDGVTLDYVERVRASLGLEERNSLLFTSETPDSYHLYFRPMLRDRKPTLDYFQKSMRFVADYYCEVYPQAKRIIRLPFGRGQSYVHNGVIQPIDYQQGLQMCKNMDTYDLSTQGYYEAWEAEDNSLPLPQLDKLQVGWKREGLVYLNTGLTAFHQRLEATKRVIYFFWSQNVAPEICMIETKKWIKNQHHHYSKDWKENYRQVYKQIEQLTSWVYNSFAKRYILPDRPAWTDNGYHTKQSVRASVQASRGSLALLKFALPLVSYCQARGSQQVQVHRDRLVSWGSAKNYLQHLDKLEQSHLLTRHTHYRVQNFAKKITLQLDSTSNQEKIYSQEDNQRAEHDVKKLLVATYNELEYYNTQKQFALPDRTIRAQITEIYGQARPASLAIAKNLTADRIATYRNKNPRASQTQASSDLALSLRTVKNYWKAYEPESLPAQALAYHQEHPLVATRTIARVLGISQRHVANILQRARKSEHKSAKLGKK